MQRVRPLAETWPAPRLPDLAADRSKHPGNRFPVKAWIGAFDLAREMDKPVRTLSGGTRQKLNAATAFMFRPSLLVLDEPTAGLDPIASGVLKEKIARAR